MLKFQKILIKAKINKYKNNKDVFNNTLKISLKVLNKSKFKKKQKNVNYIFFNKL